MKKKILVLMIIGVSCFMLPTCKFNRKKEDKREVIWTDLREDKSYIKIERGYAYFDFQSHKIYICSKWI